MENAVNSKAEGNRRERQRMALLISPGYGTSRAAESLGVLDVVGIGREVE